MCVEVSCPAGASSAAPSAWGRSVDTYYTSREIILFFLVRCAETLNFKLILKSFSSTVLTSITLASSNKLNKSWPLCKNVVGINEVQLTTSLF